MMISKKHLEFLTVTWLNWNPVYEDWVFNPSSWWSVPTVVGEEHQQRQECTQASGVCHCEEVIALALNIEINSMGANEY